MHLHYFLIHSIVGLIGLPNDADIEILPATASSGRAFLTVHREPFHLHLRRIRAFGAMLLNALVPGRNDLGDARTRFNAILSRTTILEGVGWDRPLLIVELSSATENPNMDRLFDFGDFGFVLDGLGLDRARAAERAKPTFEAAVAGLSLALSSGTTPTIESVGEFAFALDEGSERPLYSIVAGGSAMMTLATATTDMILADAAVYSRVLRCENALESVARLLSQSLQVSDNLYAFLTAWAGLEIFTERAFKDTYERQMYSAMQAGTAPAAGLFIRRLRDVMKGKYNIRDKFVVVSSFLDPIDADTDITLFSNLKKQRDGVHSMRAGPQTLETEKARTLLRKYLALYLKAKA
jgi:hypothetical protein